MRRFAGSRFAVHGSRITVHGSRLTAHGSRFTDHGSRITDHGSRVAAYLAPLWGAALVFLALLAGFETVGSSEVRVGGEVGWHGEAVAGTVNPLAITVENATAAVLSASLLVEQSVGSGWRGPAIQRLRAPVLLAPAGRVRLVFPWPVEPGSGPVTVVVEADGIELARTSLPLRLTPHKPVAVIGGGEWPPDLGPAIVLSPDDLPTDPLLLGPFAEAYITRSESVPAEARDALAAWVAFGGGSVRNWARPASVPPLSTEDLLRGARDHRPRRAPVAVVLGATALYLIALGYALPALTRRGRAWGAAGLVAVSLAFALCYPHLYGSPATQTRVLYSLSARDVARFAMDTLVLSSAWGGHEDVPGWWLERTPSVAGRPLPEISWTWGPDGPRTQVRVDPGETLILWRYGPAEAPGGTRAVVGPGGSVRADDAFAPLVRAAEPVLREGDRVYLDQAKERQGTVASYEYRLRWEPRG